MGTLVIHIREGHAPDLGSCPPTKLGRQRRKVRISDEGPMGRMLASGERDRGSVPRLAPIAGELMVDKPGKGAICATKDASKNKLNT